MEAPVFVFQVSRHSCSPKSKDMAILIITIVSFYFLSIWFRASFFIIRNLIRALEGIAWLALAAIMLGMYQNPELTIRAVSNVFRAIIWIAEGLGQVIVGIANA